LKAKGFEQGVGSWVGLVSKNALVLSGLANFRVVGNPKVIHITREAELF